MSRYLVLSLALLATLSLGHSVERRDSLEKRDCDPGATLCGSSGIFQYCANPGYKCCNTRYNAPISATCCGNGNTYAPFGNYCCSNGNYCPNGRTCRGCTPANGNGGFVGSSLVDAPTPIVTSRPALPTTTRIVAANTYYTFTITYYYYRYYYIYVQAITQSTPTSSRVTTTTRVSIFASDRAEASSSFNDLSATLSLPTPASATILAPLPSQTLDDEPASSTSARGTSTGAVVAPLPSATQLTGGVSALLEKGWYASLSAWLFGLAAGGIAIGAFAF